MKNLLKMSLLLSLVSLAIQGAPLLKIKPNARIEKLEDTISFWAGQEKEHAEFCVDFTPDETLKKEGRIIAQKFGELYKNPRGKKNEFLNLSTRIKKFQNNVKNSLSKKDKEYNIKNALIDHMNLEADYADKKVRGKRFSKNEELKFWMEEHKGEAEAIAYFMKDDKELKDDADDVAEELKKELASPKLTDAQEANNELDEIGQELSAHPEKTSMPKKLAAHEKRERERAKKTFKELSLYN